VDEHLAVVATLVAGHKALGELASTTLTVIAIWIWCLIGASHGELEELPFAEALFHGHGEVLHASEITHAGKILALLATFLGCSLADLVSRLLCLGHLLLAAFARRLGGRLGSCLLLGLELLLTLFAAAAAAAAAAALRLFDLSEPLLGGVKLRLETINKGPEILVLCLEGVDSCEEGCV